MDILVCSNGVMAESTFPVWKEPCEHNIHIISPQQLLHTAPDAIVSMSISVMPETEIFVSRYPDVPLYCYNWDCYEWALDHPRAYDWDRYGRNLLRRATEIWVPSICTGKKTKQWWKLDNWKVVLSGCETWDQPVKDEGYALCCIREMPDRNWGLFEQACEELNIPYKMSLHECGFDQYKETVANCRFLVCHNYEASTGGLSLLEGYYLGKPCLVSDSEWNGTRDYFSSRAVYFRDGDMTDFKIKLSYMYNKTPPVSKDHKEFINSYFSYEAMAQRMLERIGANADT